MSNARALPINRAEPPFIDADVILNSLECAVLVVASDATVSYINSAGEQLFGISAVHIIDVGLDELLPTDNPLYSIIKQVQEDGIGVSEYGLTLDAPKVTRQLVNIQVSEMPDQPGAALVNVFTRSIADKIDRQMTHRNAARSVTAMAAMLAHEVKNPLSGIRGAAQLLEQDSDPEDQTLTRLICDETDRICALVDRIEVFSDRRPLDRSPVNIHQVLERVRNISKTGFAKNIKIIENYDPSLPSVDGNHDQLVQIFLNLTKNAAEAVPDPGGEIVLSTAYQQGVRYAIPGNTSRTHLPLVVSIQDNGGGIPDDLKDNLFDAFVTSKPKGSGLGLALVAKMVDDHGGVIEFDSQPGETVFRVMLPLASGRQGRRS